MFDLEQAISNWRQQMLAAGIASPAPLEELESHLREEIAQQIKSGLKEQDAVDSAVLKLGLAHQMNMEFTKIEESEFMKKLRIIPGLSLLMVLLASAWLAFSATMIGKEALFRNDGLIPLRASDGAIVLVQHGMAVLQSPGTLSAGDQYHFYPLVFGFGIPFAVLVGFAIMGCCSLFQKKVA
jgi:hypothetical protein